MGRQQAPGYPVPTRAPTGDQGPRLYVDMASLAMRLAYERGCAAELLVLINAFLETHLPDQV